MTTPPSTPSWLAIVLAGLSLIGTIYIESTHRDQENTAKIAALEAHRSDDSDRLDRIEKKVDRLVTWALGKQP